MKGKKSTDEKTHYQNYTYAFKLKIVRQIDNGLISVHHAYKKYGVYHSTIKSWVEKFGRFADKDNMDSKSIPPAKQIQKLKDRIEELDLIKEFQQDMIAEYEKATGKELSKKFLPKQLADAIEKKKRELK